MLDEEIEVFAKQVLEHVYVELIFLDGKTEEETKQQLDEQKKACLEALAQTLKAREKNLGENNVLKRNGIFKELAKKISPKDEG